MKSHIFIKAAERMYLDFGGYSCVNLTVVAKLHNLPPEEIYELRAVYQNIFDLTSMATFYSKYIRTETNHVTLEEIQHELHEMRVMALLIAYEIIKSEKKSFKNSMFGGKLKRK
jgi:hypothetical protein